MKHSDVFLRTEASLGDAVALLGAVADLEFVREVHGASVSFVAEDGGRRVAIRRRASR